MEQGLGSAGAKKIGLIGGLALRAGVFYYEQTLKRYVLEKHTLKLVLNHADVDTVLTYVAGGDKAELGRHLGTIANELFVAGADVVAVTAVAPHMAIAEFARVARGPVVNVLGTIPAGLAAAQIERVAIFGNRAVMHTDAFGSVPANMVVRPEPSVSDAVHTIYNDIALTGKRGTPAEVALLEGSARDLIDRGGAQAISSPVPTCYLSTPSSRHHFLSSTSPSCTPAARHAGSALAIFA